MVIAVVGAILCTAWNFHFPTVAESVVWKVGSILTMVIPAVLAVTILRGPVALPLNNSLKLTYRLLRLYLIVEVLVAFRSVPIGIYQVVPWTSWIPHI